MRETLDFDAEIQSITPDQAPHLAARLREDPAEWNRRSGPLYRAWGKVDPAGAIADAIAQGDRSAGLAAMVAAGWAEVDPAKAGAWVGEQPPGRATFLLAKAVLVPFSQSDPAAAAGWVASLDLADPRLAGLADLAAVSYARSDAEAAFRWLDGLPQAAQERGAQAVAAEWVRAEPESGSQFLGNLPAGPARDAALAAMVKVIAREDPASAAAWVEVLPPGSERDSLSDLVFHAGAENVPPPSP